MFDNAEVVFTPSGPTQTVALVTVFTCMAFDFSKGERNRTVEEGIAKELESLFRNMETLEPNVVDDEKPAPQH